jgi:hypothetical protein
MRRVQNSPADTQKHNCRDPVTLLMQPVGRPPCVSPKWRLWVGAIPRAPLVTRIADLAADQIDQHASGQSATLLICFSYPAHGATVTSPFSHFGSVLPTLPWSINGRPCRKPDAMLAFS